MCGKLASYFTHVCLVRDSITLHQQQRRFLCHRDTVPLHFKFHARFNLFCGSLKEMRINKQWTIYSYAFKFQLMLFILAMRVQYLPSKSEKYSSRHNFLYYSHVWENLGDEFLKYRTFILHFFLRLAYSQKINIINISKT